MDAPHCYRLSAITVLDLDGAQAKQILHNLTTNEIGSLEVGRGTESFITDVRGKTLAHVMVYRTDSGFRLIGPSLPSQSPEASAADGEFVSLAQRLAGHCDRYTIREDAVPTIRDGDFGAIVLDPAARRCLQTPVGATSARQSRYVSTQLNLGDHSVDLYPCDWLGTGSAIALLAATDADQVAHWMKQQLDCPLGTADDFHRHRVHVGFPWYGVDITEANLPQEADRDGNAISFTKGCYLGQETVARLDALGQVQKKLVTWAIRSHVPKPDDALFVDGKKIARLTSTCAVDEDLARQLGVDAVLRESADGELPAAVAIGFARRSHFDPGSVASFHESSAAEETPPDLAARVVARVLP